MAPGVRRIREPGCREDRGRGSRRLAQDVKLSLGNNLLTIRSEKQQAEQKNERVHRYEPSYGTFERAFSLPTTVDPEKIVANYANGILTVTIPKAERARPREIPVKVS